MGVELEAVSRIENRLSSCRISQGFDSIAEVSECTDHSQCAYSFGLLAYRRAAFLIANAFMQENPDQLTQAVGNGPDGFIVPEARHQTTIEDLEDASFAFDGSIGSLIQNAAHLAVAFGRAFAVVHARAFFLSWHAPTHDTRFFAAGKVAAVAPTSAMICYAESTPRPGTSASRSTAS